MTTAVAKLNEVAKSLPDSAVKQVLDFAVSLQNSRPARLTSRKAAKRAVDGDAEWERILADERPRPKLAAMVREVKQRVAAGESKPMDFDRL